ncbi:hypothetical protein DL762_008209 [Monosporascus cannonballus]|uniref:rRNA biogenesis protein RRP36 n=1 Tax=Monosporascus cannonballus TaxID=155416 RepID=A0ABY0GX51_9PEZI|nr:hypothetical protein DL762_008209 [Monosporascus cannonballus]RYO81741.1 hypothetical protein DL763_008479 [Monosporascus cannonballus]
MDRPTSEKRKAPLHNLQRRVRARKDEPEPEEVFSEQESTDEEDDSEQDSEGESDEPEPSSEEDEDDDDNPRIDASRVSFGALAKAQASLPNARRKKGLKDEQDEGDGDSDSDGPPEEETKSKPKRVIGRAHKHAPAEQTTKKPVSRRREVVSAPRVAARDPRFDPVAGPVDEDRFRRAYSFLDEYQDSEMGQLREAIRKTRDERARAELKRALASMQDRRQAQRRRDEEKALLAEHRRREKELVKQGKKPFYLKKSEQKKQLLMDRFAGMRKKQVDRTIERKRKKLVAKERRDMPVARRETGS